MKRILWTIALCLLTASTATAQGRSDDSEGSRGFRGPGDDPGRRPREEREDGGRGFRGPGEEGGRGRFRGPGGPPNPLFAAIDTDSDGVISARELRKAAAAIKSLDADGDGSITLAEASPQRGPGGPGGEGGEGGSFIDRMFQRSDANGDGKLTKDEVPERMAPMLDGADTNEDGAIDRAELEAAMANMRNRGGGPGGRGGFGGPGFGGPGGGGNPEDLLKQMLSFDKNRDGVLTPDEVPEQAMGMVRGADANGDGKLDPAELAKVAERMGSRGRGGFRGPGGFGGPDGTDRPDRFQRDGGQRNRPPRPQDN
jgi:collagen type III alpha